MIDAKDERMKTVPDLIDWTLYGAMVRNRRIKLGFKTAESFSAPLWKLTRVYISRDVLYKIEQGKTPDAQQFMALNIVLFGEFFPMCKVIDPCMSNEWEYISESAKTRKTGNSLDFDIPETWQFENELAEVE